KSFGSLGGFLVSEKRVTDYIKHHSRPFIFSAAMPPSNVAAAEKALDIIQNEPERIDRLLEVSDYMKKNFLQKELNIIRSARTPIVPIYTYTPVRTLIACKLIFEKGVYVNPVLPPAVNNNTCLIRTICTAKHTESLIDEATEIISDVLRKLPETEAEAIETRV
ncbi:MAG: aminotransferase class I/II-fold pyridoxal phosphate-dependent enzyme, partial [Bacteroidota bacterium]